MNSLRINSIPLTEEMIDHFMAAAVAEKKPSVVRDTILEIGLNGLSPSSEHYRMLMAAYCRKGQMGNAKTVLNMIKANGQVGTPVFH